MFPLGNPLILQGAGRIKTDCLNENRIQSVLNKFEEAAVASGEISQFRFSINKEQLQKSAIAFPLAGFAFGLIGSYTFVHPNSRYIGKFFTLFTTWLGYQVHNQYYQAYHHSRRVGNFWNYPQEIRRMLDNNDSRYAWKWFKENAKPQTN